MTAAEATRGGVPAGALPTTVTVHEVGPREGLQSQPRVVDTGTKRAFVEALARTGLRRVEVTGFFHPVKVPQLADASDLIAALGDTLGKDRGVRLAAHIPNRVGLQRALDVGIDEVIICLSASDETARREDDDCESTADCQRKVQALLEQSRGAGVWTRVFVTNTWGCPYIGEIEPQRVRRLVGELVDAGADEICLADTLAAATPGHVRRVLDIVREDIPAERLALHFHDNRGMAVANALTGLGYGIAIIDAAVAGIGGHGMCAYVPTNPQMLATEDLLFLLDGLGVDTGIDIEAVRHAGQSIAQALDITVTGRYANAGPVERVP
jgi:hydroxymethylglutaryl-CoA lyase